MTVLLFFLSLILSIFLLNEWHDKRKLKVWEKRELEILREQDQLEFPHSVYRAQLKAKEKEYQCVVCPDCGEEFEFICEYGIYQFRLRSTRPRSMFL